MVTAANLAQLETLIAKHLLYRREQPDGQVRLEMLETVRAYALERLDEQPQHDETRRRHCEYYSDIAERSALTLNRHGEEEALRVLDRELDNIRAALGWALEHSPVGARR